MVVRALTRAPVALVLAVFAVTATIAPSANAQNIPTADVPDPTAAQDLTAPIPTAGRDPITVTALEHVGMRDAALIMSGQRGGGINGVLVVGTPGRADDGVVPFWIELAVHPPADTGDSTLWTLEVLAYALDEHLEVEFFDGQRVALETGALDQPLAGGIKLSGRIAISPATRSLRVLVRNLDGDGFFLDEKIIPMPTEGADLAEASVVFSDTGVGWLQVDSSGTVSGDGPVIGYEIDGVRHIPHGRPVILAPTAVTFFVVVPNVGEAITTISGRLHGHRGRELDAGLLTVGNSFPVSNDNYSAYSVSWAVPALDADQYSLELTLSGESGEQFMAQITLVGVSPEMAPLQPTWVAYAGGSARPSAPIASASQLAYADALRLCTSDRWNEGVTAVYSLEQRTDRRMGGTEFSADLRNLEASIIKDLSDQTPEAMIPLLVLHYDVFELWIQADDPVGRKHSIELIAAMANNVRKINELAPATSAAVGVLASMGDTLHRIGASDNARAVLELALELDPRAQAPRIGVALDHEWLGHYEEAVATLEELTDRSDALYEGRLRLAVNLLRTGKTRDAITEFRTCTYSGAPAWVRVVAYEELALYYLDEDRPDQARELMNEAIGVFPRETTLRLVSASIEESRGNLGETRRILADLDRQTMSRYRESPRKRYARWPSELFAERRREIKQQANEHLGDLGAAMSAQTKLRSQ